MHLHNVCFSFRFNHMRLICFSEAAAWPFVQLPFRPLPRGSPSRGAAVAGAIAPTSEELWWHELWRGGAEGSDGETETGRLRLFTFLLCDVKLTGSSIHVLFVAEQSSSTMSTWITVCAGQPWPAEIENRVHRQHDRPREERVRRVEKGTWADWPRPTRTPEERRRRVETWVGSPEERFQVSEHRMSVEFVGIGFEPEYNSHRIFSWTAPCLLVAVETVRTRCELFWCCLQCSGCLFDALV